MLQESWRWCKKCEGLYFCDNGHRHGICPASPMGTQEPHAEIETTNYILVLADPKAIGQRGWRWCKNCEGLFFAGRKGEYGFCSAHSPEGKTGPHEISANSGEYTLVMDDPNHKGQKNWRWCSKCEGLFFAGHDKFGQCPMDGKAHLIGATDYSLMHLPKLRRWVIKATLSTRNIKGEVYVFPDRHEYSFEARSIEEARSKGASKFGPEPGAWWTVDEPYEIAF